MKRILVLIAATAILGGCASGAVEGSLTMVPTPTPNEAQDSEAPEATDAAGASEPAPATFKAITLKGKGKKVVKFKIPTDAVAIAQSTYGGSGNFAVISIAADGSHNDLLVNTIGKYKGSVLFDASDGDHSVAFSVDAEGSWTIIVKPATSARAWNGKSVLKGTGDDVVLISPASSGLVTLDLTFKGDGNFAVTTYTPDGTDLLANEIDNFSGQVLLPDGSFLLAVVADGGTWSATPG